MSVPTTRPVGTQPVGQPAGQSPCPASHIDRRAPWRQAQVIDQLLDHGTVATLGALFEDGRETQVWSTKGDRAVVLGERWQQRLPLRGRQMEREEDDRRTATPGLIPQTSYLALTIQLNFGKR